MINIFCAMFLFITFLKYNHFNAVLNLLNVKTFYFIKCKWFYKNGLLDCLSNDEVDPT